MMFGQRQVVQQAEQGGFNMLRNAAVSGLGGLGQGVDGINLGGLVLGFRSRFRLGTFRGRAWSFSASTSATTDSSAPLDACSSGTLMATTSGATSTGAWASCKAGGGEGCGATSAMTGSAGAMITAGLTTTGAATGFSAAGCGCGAASVAGGRCPGCRTGAAAGPVWAVLLP